jgi:hypothetical protein
MSQHQTEPTAPKKGRRRALIIGGTVIGVLVVAGIAGNASKNPQAAAPAAGAPAPVTITATATRTVVAVVTSTAPAEPPVTITAGPPPATLHEGVNIVGVDVQPGTYQSLQDGCYFERLKGFGGTLDDLISNGNGATVVTIESGDKGFTSHRCSPWTKVG